MNYRKESRKGIITSFDITESTWKEKIKKIWDSEKFIYVGG